MVCLDYQVNAYFLKAFMRCAKYAEVGKQLGNVTRILYVPLLVYRNLQLVTICLSVQSKATDTQLLTLH